jgi:hypothetical protein
MRYGGMAMVSYNVHVDKNHLEVLESEMRLTADSEIFVCASNVSCIRSSEGSFLQQNE